MISSYRIHQEQIKKVEQSLKAPYQRYSADTRGIKSSGRDAVRTKQTQQDPPHLPPPPFPALRCVQCHKRIHEMDYHYTEHTGLCITCWEAQEA